MRRAITGAFVISTSLAGLVAVAVPILFIIALVNSFAAPDSFIYSLVIGKPGPPLGERTILGWLLIIPTLIFFIVFGIAGASIYFVVGRAILMFLRLWDEG